MSRPRVFVTSPRIPGNALEKLAAVAEVTVFPEDRAPTREELRRAVETYDGILCLLRDRFDRDLLQHARRLRILANYAVGYDNIDVQAATERGILVTNTPDILSNATAELAIALMFAVARRIAEADRFVRHGRFVGWQPDLFLGMELAGAVFGVVGAGRIGTLAGLKAHALGMQVVYWSRRRNYTLEGMTGARKLPLDDLLKTADVVSIHLPLTPETRHLINRERLARMKPTAILINTGRGPVIDEQALIAALKEGKIRGAGLDVYEHEPEVPEELRQMDNVVLLPHIGSATHRTREGMAHLAVENLIRVLQGQPPLTPVNPEVLQR